MGQRFHDHAELGAFEFNPPADESVIWAAEAALGLRLPESYRQLLLEADGGEGPVGSTGYLILWPVGDLVSLNENYGVGEYAPGFIVIGSDGAGEALAIDTAGQSPTFAWLPFVGMHPRYAKPLGGDISAVLSKLATEEEP